jgi:tetratricopeptide (TPR) repeat protein
MINSNLGAHYVSAAQQPENKESKNSLIDSAMKYTRRSLVIHKTPYVNSLLNIAIIYYLRNQLDSSKYYCDSLKELYTDYPSLNSFLPLLAKRYLNEGLDVSSKDLRKGINEIKKGLRENSNDADIWYNLGGAYFTSKQFDSARYCWNAALLLKPDYTQAKQGLSALPRQGKDTVKGIR